MSKQVLVTGGAGFIGSHLTDRLLQMGHRVVVLDNETTGDRRNVAEGAHYILGDVRRMEDVETAFEQGLDAVFHIAGQASVIRSFDDPTDDLDVNVVGTINIIQACLKHGVSHMLFASSMTAYGHPKRMPVTEQEPCVPISYYGITKYSAERYALSTSARNDLATPFHVTAFRMFNVYGERQSLNNPYQGIVGIFIGNVGRNEPINIFGDGEQTRDFVYIQDVVDAWIAAWNNPAAYGQVFNLGMGQDVSINRLAHDVIEAYGQDADAYPIQFGPQRPGDQRRMVADISHIQALLGWVPKIGFSDGLRRMLKWAT